MFATKVIVSGGLSGSVCFVDVSTGACIHAFDGGGIGHINKLAEAGGSVAAGGNGWIRVYDIESMKGGAFARQLDGGHTQNVTSLSFDRSGSAKWMVSAGEDGNVFIWDVRARGYQMHFAHQGGAILCGQVHPANGSFVFGDEEGFVNEWDLAGCKLVRHNSCVNAYTGLGVSCLEMVNDGSYFVCHSNNHVSVFPKQDTAAFNKLQVSRSITAESNEDDVSPTHALSPPTPMAHPLVSRTMSTFRLGGTLTSGGLISHRHPDIIVNSAKLEPIQTFANDVHASYYITSMKHVGNNNLALTASDGSLSMWISDSGDSLWTLDCILREGNDDGPIVPQYWCWDSASIVTNDTDSNRFVVGAYSDGTCKIWDSSRPSSYPVASYDCGDGKCVKSILVLDTKTTDSPIFQRRRR